MISCPVVVMISCSTPSLHILIALKSCGGASAAGGFPSVGDWRWASCPPKLCKLNVEQLIQQFSIRHGVEINYALPSILVERCAFIDSFSERAIESVPRCQGAETAPLRFNGAVRLHLTVWNQQRYKFQQPSKFSPLLQRGFHSG